MSCFEARNECEADQSWGVGIDRWPIDATHKTCRYKTFKEASQSEFVIPTPRILVSRFHQTRVIGRLRTLLQILDTVMQCCMSKRSEPL